VNSSDQWSGSLRAAAATAAEVASIPTPARPRRGREPAALPARGAQVGDARFQPRRDPHAQLTESAVPGHVPTRSRRCTHLPDPPPPRETSAPVPPCLRYPPPAVGHGAQLALVSFQYRCWNDVVS
jgi:hypothetical protein